MAGRALAADSLPLRLVLLLSLAHVGFSGCRLALTLQAVHLRASAAVVGLILGAMMVVPMFVAVPVGRWADRRGFVLPSALGFVLLSMGALLAALVPALPALGLASVLVGTGYVLAHVCVNNAIGQASTVSNRARAFSAMALGFACSGFASPMLTGWMIDAAGHAGAFAVLAVFPLAAAAMLKWPRPLPQVRASPATGAAARGSVLDLLRHAPLRAVLLITALVATGWDLFTFLVPLHAAGGGASATVVGLVVGAFGAGSFAIRLVMPWLLRSVDEWRLLTVALLLTAACYAAFPFFASARGMMLLAFLLGMVLGCGQPLAMSLVHVNAPPSRTGEAVGLRSVIISMSQTVLPLTVGALGSATGVAPMFWLTAIALAAGAVYAGRRARR